jgi:hypothetical protein
LEAEDIWPFGEIVRLGVVDEVRVSDQELFDKAAEALGLREVS